MKMSARVADRRRDAEEALRPPVRWALGHLLPRTILAVAARRGDLQAELIFSDGDRDQHTLFERMRANGPLYKGRIGFMTTSLPVVRETLSSNDFRAGFDVSELGGPIGRTFKWAVEASTRLGPLEPPSLLVTEPPDHTRYRKLVTRVFTARAVEKLRERTQTIADELLDQLEGRDEIDLVSQYCALLPVTVIAEILGVPLSERERILGFGEAAAPSLDLGLSWRRFTEVESALAEFEAWLDDHLQALRANPGDDLLSQLVQARDEGVGLDDRELKSIAGLVLAAGFETTVNLLSNGTSLLCAHPDQLEALRADPSLWPNAVDEILRFDPPVLLTGRTATRDTEIAGTPIGKGNRVTTLLAAANRDPDVFTDPNRFDVSRPNAREHVSFSAGRHFCLGAALARMEGDVGLRALFERYPQLRQLDGSRRRDTRILRGFAELPVRLGPSARVPA
jgi:cytochrome P450